MRLGNFENQLNICERKLKFVKFGKEWKKKKNGQEKVEINTNLKIPKKIWELINGFENLKKRT